MNIHQPIVPTVASIHPDQTVRLLGDANAGIAVLCFHGGGGVGGDPAMMDTFGAQLIKRRDVRIAVPQYRTLNTHPNAMLGDMLEDARTALVWAKATYPNGVWVLGASFGALLALDAVLKNPDGVIGLVLLNPVTDTGEGGFSNRVVDPDVHERLSPMRRYDGDPICADLRCLIVHGETDEVVPIETSHRFAALWPKEQCKMISLPKARHGFFNRSPRAQEAARIVERFMLEEPARDIKKTTCLPDDVRLLCCIGAQKAGTSWLHDQIITSPQVHGGQVKERHYFDVLWLNEAKRFLDPKVAYLKELSETVTAAITSDNEKTIRKISLLADQLAPFAADYGDHSRYIAALTKGRGVASVVCDFTPAYSGLTGAQFKKISALGDVRFVFVLRDPVARLWSQVRMICKDAGPDMEARCIAEATQRCEEIHAGGVYRADYARTLAALDEAGVAVKVVFYETLFTQESMDQLAQFVGVAPFEIDAERRVNLGRDVLLPEDLEQQMLHALAPQYEVVLDRFGSEVPPEWGARFDRYKIPEPETVKPPNVKYDRRDSRVLNKFKQKLSNRNPNRQIVFLHIPKTAGQTIVRELRRVCGAARFSPVHTHTQVDLDAQMPGGFRVHAGHIDWVDLETLDDDRFSFTVLRDPRERLASFYFYLKREADALSAKQLSLGENTGKRVLRARSPDDYFFGGNPGWRAFIHDHYDNFYASYFATRRIRGWRAINDLSQEELVKRALEGSQAVTGIYGLRELDRLEVDLGAGLGSTVNLQKTRVNTGPPPVSGKRWDDLLALFERDENRERVEGFVNTDTILLRRLGLEEVV